MSTSSGHGVMVLSASTLFHIFASVYAAYTGIKLGILGWRILDDGFDVWSFSGCIALDCLCLWSQVIQQVHIFCSLWLDILKAFPGRCPYSRKFASVACDFLFPTCVVPLNTIVVILFWSLYYSAPHLIENRGIMDRYLDTWMNHCLHTNIIVITLLEVIICAPKFPSRKRAFITLVLGVQGYSLTATGCRLMGGPWAYPIVQIMFSNWITYVTFQAFIISIGFAGYLAADRINKIFHGDQKKIIANSNGYHPDKIQNHVE